MCPQFPPPGQAFQRMPSAPAGHGSSAAGSGAIGGGGGAGGGGGGGGAYHRQHSDPCMPYLQQSFKQEYLDPLYERASQMSGSRGGHGPPHSHPNPHPHAHSHPHPQRFPPAHMMVKQEPTDYTYDPGKCCSQIHPGPSGIEPVIYKEVLQTSPVYKQNQFYMNYAKITNLDRKQCWHFFISENIYLLC